MRSFAPAVLITAAAIIGATPVMAQRGQYGASHPSAPARGVPPTGGGHPYPVHSAVGPPPLGLRAPASGFTGINPGAYKSTPHLYGHGHHNVPQAAYFTPYYYPFLGYTDSGYDAYPPLDTAQDPEAQAAAVTANMLGQQIQDLSVQIDQLRDEQHAARAQQAAPPPEEAGPAEEPQPPQAPPIRLVLRTGQEMQVHDYAIVDGVFWDFSSQPVRRIPVSNINIPASQKATEDSGAEFPKLAPR
jgi:hypothetical protein